MKNKDIIIRSLILAALGAVALCGGGCTSTTYREGDVEFSRTSFLSKQNIGKVEMKAGDKSLSIEGYSNEQTEIAAAVAGSVAKALTPAK